MNLIIHRGAHEIGGSCVEIQSKNSRIIIDIGIPLEEKGEKFDFRKYKHLSGPELVKAKVLPDVKGLYKWDKDSKPVDAILISHAHLDHYGYLPFVDPGIPVFMSKGSKELLGIAHYFGRSDYGPEKAVVKPPWKYFDDIPGFAVRPYLVDHSAPDAFAYLVKADGKRIFYSGDFRGHGKKKILFDNMLKYPPGNVDVLILEGTTVESDRKELGSEQEIEDELVKLFKNKKQLIIFSCSHQNIDRLTVLYNACLRSGRTMVILPYTAYILEHLKILSAKLPRFDMPQIKVFFEKTRNTAMVKRDREFWARIGKAKISYDDIAKEPEKLVVLDSKFVRERFAAHGFLTKALLVYSLWGGYLENAAKFWNEKGVHIKKVHTSGHAYVPELKALADAIDPGKIVPIHTQKPEKFRELFGSKAEILQNGQSLQVQSPRAGLKSVSLKKAK